MMPYLPQILAGVAGFILYIVLYEYIEQYLKINIKTNKLFPLFIIITLLIGLFAAQTIHMMDVMSQNSNAQQTVSIYWCLIEDSGTCGGLVNTINNTNYNTANSTGVLPFNLYIPISLTDLLQKNAFSYFCVGILLSWIIILLGGKTNARKI